MVIWLCAALTISVQAWNFSGVESLASARVQFLFVEPIAVFYTVSQAIVTGNTFKRRHERPLPDEPDDSWISFGIRAGKPRDSEEGESGLTAFSEMQVVPACVSGLFSEKGSPSNVTIVSSGNSGASLAKS